MVSASDLTSKYGESTARFVIYSFFSMGIYTYVWLFEKYKVFNKMVGHEVISRKFLLSIILISGLALMIEPNFSAHPQNIATKQALSFLAWFMKLSVFVLLIICAFRIRTIFIKYFVSHFQVTISINPVLVVLFHIFYINYCLNTLEAKVQKAQAKESGAKKPTTSSARLNTVDED